jgi:hypothetical protein
MVKGLVLLPLMVTIPEEEVLVMPPAPIVILLAVVVPPVLDWMVKACLKVIEFATAAVFKDILAPPAPPLVMLMNTSSAARGTTLPTFTVVSLLVQLAPEAQVAPALPSQKRLTAWAAGALTPRIIIKRGRDFLDFINLIRDWEFCYLGLCFCGAEHIGNIGYSD